MAVSVPTKYYKAMLDTIAYTEGTLGVSQNGYDVLYNYYTIDGWSPDCTFGHKGNDWLVSAGSYDSTGAGRYAFLDFVWWENSGKNATELGLTKLTNPLIYKSDGKEFKYYYNAPFNKANQDYLGYKLVAKKVSEDELIKGSKSATDFSNMLAKAKLDCTWTSLARAVPVGTDVKKRCGYKQAEPGKVVNKTVCSPSTCSSGAEEVYAVFTKALAKY